MMRHHATAAHLDQLTDVQLLHRLNDAIREREQTADTQPRSWATQLLRERACFSAPLWSFVAIALQVRDALNGAWLAVSFASSARIEHWSARSETRSQALREDIAILRLLGEMAQRVSKRGADKHEPYPGLYGG